MQPRASSRCEDQRTRGFHRAPERRKPTESLHTRPSSTPTGAFGWLGPCHEAKEVVGWLLGVSRETPSNHPTTDLHAPLSIFFWRYSTALSRTRSLNGSFFLASGAALSLS